jgi:outer membrane receptor protein involved in Fe transport
MLHHYRLSVRSLGFAKKVQDIRIRKDTVVHITLYPLKGFLNQVTIVGNKPVIEHKADRTIFNVANSINAAGSNGLEVLKKAPGIKISDKTISLAGSGSLGIMVNGRLLHLSDKALLNYLKSFSSAQISKIEIITHPSARYDAEGNAGLVNIITRKSNKAGLSGSVEGSIKRFFYEDQPDYKGIKNYGDIDGGIGLDYNNKKWSAYTKLNYSKGREIWGYGIDVYYPDKHWAMKDTGEYRIATFNALGGIDYALSNKTTVGFEYNYIYHMEEGADYVRVPIYNQEERLDSNIRTYATYYPIAKSNAFNLHLIQNLNNSEAKLTLNANYFNFYRTDKSNSITRSYTRDGKLKQKTTQELYDTTLQNIRIYTFKADVSLPASFAQFSFGSKINFINNFSNIFYYHKLYGKRILDTGLSNEFRYIENTQALYADASKDMNKWKVDAGLRAELTETKAVSYFEDTELRKSYLKLFPSLLLSYKLNNKQSLSFSYNKRIHRPTFWNLNPFKTFMTAYTYVEGNPYLEPEYITNIQLSHQYKHLLTSSLYIKVINNGFAQVIKTHVDGSYIHTTTMLNFTRAYRYGLSESLSFQPFSRLESFNQVSGYYTKVNSDLSYINGIDGWGLYAETNNTFYFNQNKTFNGFLGVWYQFPEVDHFGKSNAYYDVNLGLQLLTLQKRLSISLNFSDVFQSSASKLYTIVDQVRNTYTDFQLNSQIRLSATWNFGNNSHKQKRVTTGNEAERSRTN